MKKTAIILLILLNISYGKSSDLKQLSNTSISSVKRHNLLWNILSSVDSKKLSSSKKQTLLLDIESSIGEDPLLMSSLEIYKGKKNLDIFLYHYNKQFIQGKIENALTEVDKAAKNSKKMKKNIKLLRKVMQEPIEIASSTSKKDKKYKKAMKRTTGFLKILYKKMKKNLSLSEAEFLLLTDSTKYNVSYLTSNELTSSSSFNPYFLKKLKNIL